MPIPLRFFVSMIAVMTACGTAGAVIDPSIDRSIDPSIDNVAVIRTARGLETVSAGSGEVRLRVPDGVAAYDYSVFATTTYDGNRTEAALLDAAGAELARSSIAGELSARVVSGSGRLVALTDPRASGTTPYLPAPKSRTRVVVMDSSGAHRDYLLEGNFEPEAFKLNDRELFVIEYIPALAPNRYRVRRLRLGRGDVVPIGRLKGLAPDQMNGTGRTQVPSPDGEELYTLYTQQSESGHEDGHHSGTAHAFVHLLNLRYSWAHCIDLPDEFASGTPDASALAMDPSGDRLYVIEGSAGYIASINPRRVRVIRSAELELVPSSPTVAAANGGRVFVSEAGGVAVIDADTLMVTDRWAVDGRIQGLHMSPDGRHLYVSLANEIVVVDRHNGEAIHSVIVEDVLALEDVG